MPACPHCRRPFAAAESATDYLTTCPHCGVKVAIAGTGADAFADLEPDPVPSVTGRYHPGARRTPLTAFLVLVGLLVAVVMSLILYDRFSHWRARTKLRELNEESLRIHLREKRTAAEEQRLWDIDGERWAILRDHPELRR